MDIRLFTAENILKRTRIKPWKHLGETRSIWDYLAHRLNEEEQSLIRFAPKVEVVTLEDPKNASSYEGWRSQATTWATVLALTPENQVVLAIEYKHGIDDVIVGLPAGVGKKGESLQEVMSRELLEESGFEASELIPLGNYNQGIAISGRKSSDCFFSFLANNARCISEQRLDDDENIEVGLTSLEEWLKMIEQGIVREASAIVTTFLALQKLKKL